MSDLETRFHETWLGMVQPIEGLVFSIPVLVEAQCLQRQSPEMQHRLLELCPEIEDTDGKRRIADFPSFLENLLELTPDLFDGDDQLSKDLSLYVPEGRQTLRPTLALRRFAPKKEEEAPDATPPSSQPRNDATPASLAGGAYTALLWELPDDLDLDKPETITGPWDYPPQAKFDRLLRHCRVPIGILTNRRAIRLVYAPHGESSGAMTFRIDDMASVGGRPILDALVMLLSATRWFAVAPERQLPALLAESRRRQADVTNELAEQVFQALNILLRGFETAAERDGRALLDDALEEHDHLYGGLLTVLLRLVFILYAEERDLLPVSSELYADHMSLLGLFDQLQEDSGAYPETMHQRFGAWGRLVSLFRAIFLGCEHGELRLPARKGELFDPHRYPFLEGWGPGGSAPITQHENRAKVRLPSVDDGTVYRVLEKLLLLQGQRLSYRALDVEQIGSVYEALMGYHVVRLADAAVCLRPNRVWLTARSCVEQSKGRLPKWLQEETGLAKAQAKKLGELIGEASGTEDEESVLQALESFRIRNSERARPGRLVIQPGAERRRTSSHYTPRSLSAPIVKKTLEPLIAAMGKEPSSESLLELKVCDPAMGSGAFLVEACRFLADQVVAAWTREQQLDKVASAHEDVVNHARRLVAQRCLYGVDKNAFAVSLAKLSLWLITLAKDEPFTFVDHALRHGDSLVGLSFDQIRAFHWAPKKQLEFASVALRESLDEALELRQRILELADDGTAQGHREKEMLLRDAEDALDRVRLIGDLVVGAFFGGTKTKKREAERVRREGLVFEWLQTDEPPPRELLGMQEEVREQVPVFHWMLEFPEVFHPGRMDPLVKGASRKAAFLDAVIGNPPFLGGKRISTTHGDAYAAWLAEIHQAGKNGDICAHFFRRADVLLGDHGTIGLIATNTVAQGDTRAAGLQYLLGHGFCIHDAIRMMAWPGEAAVSISVVHLAKGSPAEHVVPRLDGIRVPAVSSRLRGRPERPDPQVLQSNAGLSFQGSILFGMGFTLSPAQHDELVRQDPHNAQRIFPYLGGEEVNTSPTQTFHRSVISFSDMSLEKAQQWPDLLRRLQEEVRPERERKSKEVASWPWWQFWRPRLELYESIGSLARCLVTSRHSKHWCMSFQPTNLVFAESLYVFPLDGDTSFAVLQCRIHEVWARLLSSSMKTDLRYAASDCFENFPFPRKDPRAVISALEDVGSRLYEARARHMVETNQGLTQTYNLIKDAGCQDTSISELRNLHLQMDRAVLATYGWGDMHVPPITVPATDTERQDLEAFNDEVIDRLFVLNAERAEAERLLGRTATGNKGKSRRRPRKQGSVLPFGSDSSSD